MTFTAIAPVFAVYVTLTLLGLCALWIFKGQFSKRGREHAFCVVMTLPIIAVAVIAAESPLPAVVSCLQAMWPQGPSG